MNRFKKGDLVLIYQSWECVISRGSVVSDSKNRITLNINGEKRSFEKHSGVVIKKCDLFPENLDVVSKTKYFLMDGNDIESVFDTMNDLKNYLRTRYEKSSNVSFTEFIECFTIEKRNVLEFVY